MKARLVMTALLLLVASRVGAEGQVDVRDTVDWHVVSAGETLELITERYLGTKDLWYENWRLNPQVKDPNLLHPGQRLRVIKERQIPAKRAALRQIANDVDKNPQRRGWEDAVAGDEVNAPAGIRTNARSSALVALDDGTDLTLTEHTQIFLKEITTTVTGVQRGRIEIERGQADLGMRTSRPERTDIEIVMGDTIARPRVGSGGRAETRARRADSGPAQVMVYGGSSKIAAGGQVVDVPTGMGTSVPEGGVPAPPEKLLARPTLVGPGRAEVLSYRNPRFQWRPVPGATRYTVEVCRDAACSGLVTRQAEIEATVWQPEGALPDGTLHWRVTAVAPSGLDGYPSGTRAVQVKTPCEGDSTDALGDGCLDLAAPTVVATRVGLGSTRDDGTLVLGAVGGVRLHAHDDASGAATVRYRWDGGAWATWRGRDLRPPRPTDTVHRLEVEAEDTLGRVSAIWGVDVLVMTNAPAPPTAERVVVEDE